jgi:hypothetical protein
VVTEREIIAAGNITRAGVKLWTIDTATAMLPLESHGYSARNRSTTRCSKWSSGSTST